MQDKNSTDSSGAKVVDIHPDEETEWAEEWANWDKRKDDDRFISQVMAGLAGHNIGLGNGLKVINQYIHGTHRGRYILIGADSGVGKTTLADFMYVYSLWLDCRARGIKLYLKYFSFEISKVEKIARWVCQWIKHHYKKDFSSDFIMGRIPGNIPQKEDVRMIMKGYAIVEEVLRDVEIFENVLHPTGMLNKLIEEHYEKIGKVHRDEPKHEGRKGLIRGFKAHDPQQMTVAMVDHMALTHFEKGITTTKQAMDKWSMYCVQLRNLFGTTIINIQQFSTNMMSAYREQKKTESAICPQRLDFGDSSYTYRDADLVFGLVKPTSFNLPKYFQYDLTSALGDYFIGLHLMKNRYGPADRMIPLFMNPIAGIFFDVPAPDENLVHFITEAQRINKLASFLKAS